MNDELKELIDLKFESNLLYVISILEKQEIKYEFAESTTFKLFVNPVDYDRAINVVDALDLDESPVSDESDGYIQGYNEWVDKQYVSGYFTGGAIPKWMYSRLYARYAGPVYLLQGCFFMYMYSLQTNSLTLISTSLPYAIIGLLLTFKGFTKSYS